MGRSIVTNAAKHKGAKVVVNIDLKDFFPSITKEMVASGTFKNKLEPTEFKDVLRFCFSKGRLPQGAPTSPAIANIVCWKLDVRLAALAAQPSWRATYTRYADDLTFSSRKGRALHKIIPLITKVVEEEGFSVNTDKIRVMRHTGRISVTGLVVNRKVNLPREEARRLRAIFHQAKPESDLQRLAGYAGFVTAVNRPKGRRYTKQIRALAKVAG